VALGCRSRVVRASRRLAAHVPGRYALTRALAAQADPSARSGGNGADAEVDIIEQGRPLAEFYRLSMVAIGSPAVEAGALTPDQAAALNERPAQPDFLSCGFVHIGVWGRRPLSR
jgi:hypothetical protein